MENSNYLSKRKQIDSLQALRGLAFLGIFLFHTNIPCFGGAGAWGVSVFFILSGFVMVYSYFELNRIDTPSFFGNLKFAFGKVKGIYLLHMLMTLAFLLPLVIGTANEELFRNGIKLLLNVFLIQEWFPIDGSINSVSWYLSVAVFCYFIFPWVLKYMEKHSSRKQAFQAIAFLYLFQVVIGFIGSLLPNLFITESNWLCRNLTKWFVYCFPPVRCIDFLIGCNVGYLFITRDRQSNSFIRRPNILSIITILTILIGNYMHIALKPITQLDNSTLATNPERWWTYSVCYTLSSCLLVYLAAHGNNLLSKCLTNRIMIYLGNISQYMFLIHFVVFRYMSSVIVKLFGQEFSVYHGPWINLTIGFIISLIATKIYMLLFRKNFKYQF